MNMFECCRGKLLNNERDPLFLYAFLIFDDIFGWGLIIFYLLSIHIAGKILTCCQLRLDVCFVYSYFVEICILLL